MRPWMAIIDRAGAAIPDTRTSSDNAMRRVSSLFATSASFCSPNTASAPDICRSTFGSVCSFAITRCAPADSASLPASASSIASSLSV
jgi:hypothetical protein